MSRPTGPPSAETADLALFLDEVVVLGDLVTTDEQDELSTWADDQDARGRLIQNPVDAHARSSPYLAAQTRRPTRMTERGAREESDVVWVPDTTAQLFDPLPEVFWTIRRRVVEVLAIDHLPDDPYKGSFLTRIAPGGDVHQHKDDRLLLGRSRVPLLRCNVLASRPDVGGLPVVEGTVVDVPERGMWAFHPTETVHSATTTCGERARLLLSFGFVSDLLVHWSRALRVDPALGRDVVQGVRAALFRQPMRPDRARALAAMLDREGTFTVDEVANEIGSDPETVWDEARRLRQLNMVTTGAAPPAGGRVVIV